MKLHTTLFAAGLIVFAVALPAGAEEVVVDGKKYVRNSETPKDQVALDLEADWSRGDEEDDLFFGLPGQILHDSEGNVYVLDTQVSEIIVFDRDGEHLRTIGREGEGPGEFRNAADMYVGPGDVIGVLSVFPGKVVQLTLDGEPAGNFRLPQREGEGFLLTYRGRANQERIVIAGSHQTGPTTQTNWLKAFDKNGKELAHYHTMEEQTQFGGMKFDETIWGNFKGRWTMAPDGRVAAVLGFAEYQIHVWNPDGTLLHVIERPDYPALERTSLQKERFQKMYDGFTSWNPGSTFKVSETHRTVEQVWYRPDGSLWAQTGRGVWDREEGVFIAFDVYDKNGNFAQHVRLRGDGNPENDGLYFAGDRLYRVSDSFSAMMAQFGGEAVEESQMSDEPLQVFAYPLDAPELGLSN